MLSVLQAAHLGLGDPSPPVSPHAGRQAGRTVPDHMTWDTGTPGCLLPEKNSPVPITQQAGWQLCKNLSRTWALGGSVPPSLPLLGAGVHPAAKGGCWKLGGLCRHRR